jgi:hypothetical protein
VPEVHRHIYRPLKNLKDILQGRTKLKEIDLDEDNIRVGFLNLYFMSFVVYEFCNITNQKSRSCELRILLVDIINKVILGEKCDLTNSDISLIISFISQISKHLTLGVDLYESKLIKSFYLGFLDMEIHKYFIGTALWSHQFKTKRALTVLRKSVTISEDIVKIYKNSYMLASIVTS